MPRPGTQSPGTKSWYPVPRNPILVPSIREPRPGTLYSGILSCYPVPRYQASVPSPPEPRHGVLGTESLVLSPGPTVNNQNNKVAPIETPWMEDAEGLRFQLSEWTLCSGSNERGGGVWCGGAGGAAAELLAF